MDNEIETFHTTNVKVQAVLSFPTCYSAAHHHPKYDPRSKVRGVNERTS